MCKRTVGFYVLAAMIVFATACGKSGTSASPVAPSNAQPPTAPAAMTGATIAGVVTSGTLSAASAALIQPAAVAGGITVSIMGTSISAIADASGHFTLQNVPSGDVMLAFTAAGNRATVTVTGVNAADQIHVSVVVNGNSADMDEHQREGADHQTEVEGRVTATACTANPPTITVGVKMPTTVDVQNAQIRHGGTTLTCAQIQVNDRAEAHGMTTGSMLIATDVNVETEHPQPPTGNDGGNDKDTGENQEADVSGAVSGAAAGHACPAFSFSVGSNTVTTSAATKFEDVTCAAVVNGIRVEVEGTRTAANAITAKKVAKK